MLITVLAALITVITSDLINEDKSHINMKTEKGQLSGDLFTDRHRKLGTDYIQ